MTTSILCQAVAREGWRPFVGAEPRGHISVSQRDTECDFGRLGVFDPRARADDQAVPEGVANFLDA